MAELPFFGLDIGSANIKIVQLARDGDKNKLISFGMIASPPRGISSDSDFDLEALAKTIEKIHKDAKVSTDQVVLSLPESKIFTRVITDMPVLSDDELASALPWQAEQYVPIPLKEVTMDWQVIYRPKDASNPSAKMEVLLVAAPNTVINKYMKVLKMANLRPVAVETEIIALARSLVGNNPYSPTTLIVNLGAQTTDLSIVRVGAISFTRSIATGGTALARAVAQELGFELPQAEEYKKTYGLDDAKLEGKISEAIRPVFEIIVNEVKRALVDYKEKNADDSVKRVVLSGGSAKLPNVAVYIASALGLEVQVGDPWFNIQKDQKITQMLAEDAPYYAVACGLALKEI